MRHQSLHSVFVEVFALCSLEGRLLVLKEVVSFNDTRDDSALYAGCYLKR